MLERVGAARFAEADRGVERRVRAAVVARDLQRRAEPLVDLGGLEREPVLEREREPGADRLHAVVELAALGPRDALEPEGPRAQVDALGASPASSPRQARELDRLAVLAGALQVAGGDQSLGGGLAGEAVGGEGVGRDDARAASARSRSPCSS